jgi:3-phenylpropionate/trans-cinnamate dioxygenase ferredoxin subunit
MAKHVVAPAASLSPGERLRVDVAGTPVVIFNLDGEFHGLLDRCPHMGGPLSGGVLIGLVEAEKPGCYAYSRAGEIIRCPWHGWEFDIRTGKSRFDPNRWKTRPVDVDVEDGESLKAEKIEVAQEGAYIVVNM